MVELALGPSIEQGAILGRFILDDCILDGPPNECKLRAKP